MKRAVSLPHNLDREKPKTSPPFLTLHSALKTVGNLPPTACNPASHELRHPPARPRFPHTSQGFRGLGAHAHGVGEQGLAAGEAESGKTIGAELMLGW